MNFGKELHDLDTSKLAAQKALNQIVETHNFTITNLEHLNSSDVEYIGVKKNELTVFFIVSKREAFDLFFSNGHRKISVFSFVTRKYGMFSEEEMRYPVHQMECANEIEQYTEDYYLALMQFDLKFMIDNYAIMFDKGILSE